MGFLEYYENKRDNRNIENEKECVKAASNKDKWLIEKIENSIKKNELLNTTTEEALKDIVNGDKYAIARFKKLPTRQNISEETQIEYCANNGLTLVKPSVHWYIENGEFTPISKVSDETRSNQKSLDFRIEGKDVVIAAKLANGTGGHQDSTYKEMAQAIKSYNTFCDRLPNSKCNFVILADGTYYSVEIRGKLKSFVEYPDRIHVLTTDELILNFK